MSATLDRKLHQAAAALAAGDLARAERLSREVLHRAPRHPRALQLAAAARLQQEDGAGAGELLQRALENDPNNTQVLEGLGAAALKAENFVEAESWLRRAMGRGHATPAALSWLGISLSHQGRSAEAVDAFRRAAVAGPEDPGVHLNLGNELKRVGAWDDAITSYQRALRLRPDYPEALNGLGSVLKIRRDLEGAVSRFGQAIALRPDYAEAHDNLGEALLRMDKDAEAEASFRRAVALEPDNADYHTGLGNALAKQKRSDEAMAQYEHALRLRPESPETLNSMGSAFLAAAKPDEALEPIRRAIALRPDYPEAHDNLGNALLQLGREEEANASFRRTLELQPDNALHHFRFGNALMNQQLWDEAIVQFERALELDAAVAANARFGLGGVRLFLRDFERGWQGYEARHEMDEFRKKHFRDSAASDAFKRLARWRGPSETGVGEVAIWYEQGIGDQVLFSTLIPELIAAGVPILYEVDRRLLGAYQRAFPGVRFVVKEEPPHDALQQASRVLSMGSLPSLFRCSRESFARQPQRLIAALPERVAHYRSRLDAVGAGLKVGVSWRSARQDWPVRTKTAPLADFAPLATLPGVQFVDVQYGDTSSERGAVEAATGVRLTRFEEVDYYNDLEEVLAILEACDLVITTSNATAHFAAALGKRTWLLYLADRAPFHYWAHEGDYRCLWYPAVEIVTAPQLTEWPALIEVVKERLRHELAQVEPGVCRTRV